MSRVSPIEDPMGACLMSPQVAPSPLGNALLAGDLVIARALVSDSSGSGSVCVTEEYRWKGALDPRYHTVACSYSLDLLVLAAKLGDETAVRSSISSSKEEDLANRNTALWFACRYNHSAIADQLFRTGASPDSSLFGVPCVHLSAYQGAAPLLSSFLQKQPDLSLLAMSGSVILDMGPDSSPVRFPDGALPLHLSAISPSPPPLDLLVPPDIGIDPVDSRGRSPLMYACKGGSGPCVRALIERGADLECESRGGKRGILYATRLGNTEVVELLVRSGAWLHTRDKKNRGVFFYAKDEEVANQIIGFVIKFRRESPHRLLPICELGTQGYTGAMGTFLDSLVTTPSEDMVQLDLSPLDTVPLEGGGSPTSLLGLFCEQSPSLSLFDSLLLRGYTEYHMKRYGYLFLAVMLLELTLYLVALSIALILGVKTVNANRATSPLEVFRLVCECYVALRWFLHATFEVVEWSIIFKNIYESLNNKSHKLTNLNPTKNSLFTSTFRATSDYVADSSNTIDYLLLTSAVAYLVARVLSILVDVRNVTAVFSVLVYFFSYFLLIRYVIVIPVIGTYLQTLFEALKDSLLFLLVFMIPLVQFSGMFYISYLAPPPQLNPFNSTRNYEGVRSSFDQEYYWLLLNGLRLLIEQGAIIKFNYLEVYNWLMVIVFMCFLFLTLLVMRSLFVGRISSNYKRINQVAMRFTTYRTLRFLKRIHTRSIYSLNILKIYQRSSKKEIQLKKREVRENHLSEFNRLFSKRRSESGYVRELEASVSQLRREVTRRLETQDRKLEELLECVRRLLQKE